MRGGVFATLLLLGCLLQLVASTATVNVKFREGLIISTHVEESEEGGHEGHDHRRALSGEDEEHHDSIRMLLFEIADGDAYMYAEHYEKCPVVEEIEKPKNKEVNPLTAIEFTDGGEVEDYDGEMLYVHKEGGYIVLEFKHDERRRRLSEDDHGDHGDDGCVVLFSEYHLDDIAAPQFFNAEGKSLEMLGHVGEFPSASATITGEIWAVSLGATFLICLCSMTVVVLMAFEKFRTGMCACMLDPLHERGRVFGNRLISIATGALLAALFTHIIPEAAEMLGGLGNELGLLIMGGIFAGVCIESVCNLIGAHHGHLHHSAVALPEAKKADSQEDEAALKDQANNSVTGSSSQDVEAGAAVVVNSLEQRGLGAGLNIIFGDALHNIADGVLIASAFMLCNPATGWIVTLAIAMHEIPQEILDFAVLVRCGWSVKNALLANFASSVSALLGTIAVLAVGTYDEALQGGMIGISSGVLLFVALSELLPEITHSHSRNEQILNLFLFLVGVGAIYAINLFHPHCEAAHAGHDH